MQPNVSLWENITRCPLRRFSIMYLLYAHIMYVTHEAQPNRKESKNIFSDFRISAEGFFSQTKLSVQIKVAQTLELNI